MNLPVFLLRFVQVVSPITFVRNWVRLRTAPLRALSPVGLLAEMMDYIDRCIGLAHELGCTVQTPEEAGFISNTKPPVKTYDGET
jgi:hypothetical protein